MPNSFLVETELPGKKVNLDNFKIISHRYYWVSKIIEGKKVLEVGCGPGLGLGWLSRHASRVVAADITWESIEIAKKHYDDRVDIVQMDAHKMPFADASFDAIICVAAIIYIDLPVFLQECRRVLQKTGKLIINTPNKDIPGFCPSRLSRQYYSIPQLNSLLMNSGFNAQFYGAFPIASSLARLKCKFSHYVVKFISNVLKFIRIYAFVKRLSESITGGFLLKNELGEYEMSFVENIEIESLPAGLADNSHRIIYIDAHL